MKPSSTKFLLFLFLSIFFIALLVCAIMMSQGVTTVYGAEPSPTMNWGYPIVTPTISGYPVTEPTEVNGYPAPQSTEIGGYPVPISSDPLSPFDKSTSVIYYTSDYNNEEQMNVSSPIQKLKEIMNIIINFVKTNKTVKYYGKIIFEMR